MLVKKFMIKTWGCQMNVYDSMRISEILQEKSITKTEDLSEADLIILNTCHIREKATEKIFSEIGRLKVLKDRRKQIGKDLIIAITGCVAQAVGEEIIKRAPAVSMVVGPQSYPKIGELVDEVNSEKRVLDTDFPLESKFDKLPVYFSEERISGGSSFLAIQEGCDKFCTYCVVPYTRGAEYSRPVWQVLNEAQVLAEKGAKEITLLGQNVNAYHGIDSHNNEKSLGFLIRELAKIDKIERIRYVTSYPSEVNDELIEAHRDVEKLMPFVHLPVQSGSDKILKAMNRRHDSKEYLTILEKFRKARSDIAFSSDFIVGFPGETDKDFQDTLRVIEEAKFIQSFSFSYSPRPGTPAANFDEQVELAVKEERLSILQDLLRKTQINFNKDTVGKTFGVLIDKEGKKPNQYVGKSPYMQATIVDNLDSSFFGKIVNLKVKSSSINSLKAEVIENNE